MQWRLCITKNKKKLKAVSSEGLIEFNSKTVIITSGARERHSFEIGIAGYRPAGIYTAGQTQTMMDLYGVMPGKEVVIIGSGDVGLIMARRFTLQGAEVKAVVEILPYPGGLIRNVQQCLLDFDIPLYLSHKAIRILGKNRVKGVTIVKVDEKLSEIPGTEFEVKCDTVIVSAGLIPRVELLERVGVEMDPSTRSVAVNEFLETSIPGVFVAGNALVINDLVDYAAIQGETAARSAVDYIQDNRISSTRWKPVIKGRNLRLIVPQYISGQRDVSFYARVMEPEERVYLIIPEIEMNLYQKKVSPPEMLNFIISKRKFEILQDNKLAVSIETRR